MLNILLATLAVFYLTFVLTTLDGPFDMLENLRKLTDDYRGINLDCFYCTVALVALPFALFLASGITVLVYWFGLAGAAMVINEVVGNE